MARKRKNNALLWIVLATIAVLIIGYFFTRGERKTEMEVTAEAAENRTIVETVYASGNIYPVVEVEITSNISGTIVALNVEEGEKVKEGQLLARVDPEALNSIVERAEAAASGAGAQLKSIKAQKEQLLAQFKSTKAAHERNAKLYKDGVISKAEFETSLASYETSLANIQTADENIRAAEFTVKSSKATVKEQKKNLSQTRIYAPMDGVVSVLYKKQGEQVVGTAQMAGTPILKIANLNSVEAQVKVNERDILKVISGDTADIELDAYPGRKFAGVVTQIANTANNIIALQASSDQVIDFKVHIRMLPDSYKDLQKSTGEPPFRAGLSASAEIRTNTVKNILTVPIVAVTAREEEEKKGKKKENSSKNDELKEYVFVKQQDTVLLKEVITGIQDDEFIQILKGIMLGDSVITAPYDAITTKLETGKRVKVVDEDELYKREDNDWSKEENSGN